MPHLLDPPSLRTEAEYRAALDELTALIEAWEAQAHPPPAAMRWRLARP